jgi:hypothetical protein
MNQWLDAAIGQSMGLLPEVITIATSDNGASCALTSRTGGISAVEQFCEKYPQYKIGHWEFWPAFSSDLFQAFEAVEWMRGQGYTFEMRLPAKGKGKGKCAAWFSLITSFVGIHESPPYSIALAIAKALGIEVPA